jgi:polyphosphate:AMP phosphotransferase
MLETLDLSKKMTKSDYQARMADLKTRLGRLQRQAREAGLPLIIVFEGWNGAGKGTLINNLILSMDPRGFNVFSIKPPIEEEFMRPFLWRFWTKLPDNGRTAIFNRSWYGWLLKDFVDKIVKKKDLVRKFENITDMERQLVDGGAVMIKFFLHISKKEQKKRFKKLTAHPSTSWRITKEDWREHNHYEEYCRGIETMLEATSTGPAPWTAVAAHDLRQATFTVFDTVVTSVHGALVKVSGVKAANKKAPTRAFPGKSIKSSLDAVDLSLSLTQQEYEIELKKHQKKIWELEHEIYVKRIPVSVVFEGWDAAGKGGAIKRLVEGLDPRGYEVVPFAAPNDIEKRHHYLWRFWNKLPKAGHITIFDRSWYGRVLVERVEGFCGADEWKRAYDEINETEAQWTSFGMALVKFWLHIDSKEQLRRFNERQGNPDKQWKITDEDWRNRENFDLYKIAIDEMVQRTGTKQAPWTIVEANSKLYARIKVLRTVIEAIERAL